MFLFTPQRPEEEEFPNGAEVATACTFIVYFVNLFTLDFTNLYCWLVIIVLKSLTFLWGYIFLPTISSTDLFSESSHTMIQLSMLHVQQGALCLSRALQRSIVNLCAADVFEHTLSVLHKCVSVAVRSQADSRTVPRAVLTSASALFSIKCHLWTERSVWLPLICVCSSGRVYRKTQMMRCEEASEVPLSGRIDLGLTVSFIVVTKQNDLWPWAWVDAHWDIIVMVI